MDRYLLRVHGPLVLAALFISSVIWLMARQGELESDQLTIPITLEGIPENVEIDYTPRYVPVLVKFPHNQRGRIVAQNFSLKIDVLKQLGPDPRTWGGVDGPEIHRVALNVEDVTASGVPPSVRITEFIGRSQVEIQAKLHIAWMPVRLETEGELPASYELKAAPRAEPAQVLVTAPYSELQRLRDEGAEIKTDKVRLTGRTADFIDYPGLIVPPNLELVHDSDRKVQVFILITEKEVTRSVTDVPIDLFVLSEALDIHVTPPVAEIRLKGKISLISQVDANSFIFSPKEFLAEEEGFKKKVEIAVGFKKEVPLEIREGVKIEGQMPALVEVEFTRAAATGPENAEDAGGDGPGDAPDPAAPPLSQDAATSPTL